jgi:multidrug efflux pump subunit AcrA (membrane-fusion protein)
MGGNLRVQKMKLFVPAVAAAVIGTGATIGEPAKAIEPDSLPAAQVTVVRAVSACFSAAVRVTGFLVARSEAVVTFETPGFKISEVLVGEGERVTAGQNLVRLTPISGDGSATTLKAPAAGLVTRSTAAIAATASGAPGEPLFRIAIDNEIELEADIPSIHVPMLATGQSARIQLADGRELSGRVRLVPASVDQKTQLGRARVSLERASGLRLGIFARATIDASRSCGISVPRAAVTYRTEGASVQIVRERENVVETRRVQIGFHSDDDIEIRNGLREGDTVVANAGSSLRDGDKVKPIADGAR